MRLESSREREFTELVSYHIFSDKDRNMLLPIVNTECMSDKFWSNRAGARPCLDD